MDVLTDQLKDITQMSADEAGIATAKFIKENLFYLNCIHSAFAIHRKGFYLRFLGDGRFRHQYMSPIVQQYFLNLEFHPFQRKVYE